MNTWFIANGSSVIDLALWKGIGSSSSPDRYETVPSASVLATVFLVNL
jgi:hypothetical protein